MQGKIEKLIQQGAYYPQEVLKTTELQTIWKEADWHELIQAGGNASWTQ